MFIICNLKCEQASILYRLVALFNVFTTAGSWDNALLSSNPNNARCHTVVFGFAKAKKHSPFYCCHKLCSGDGG